MKPLPKILPIAAGLFQFIQTRMSRPGGMGPSTDPQQRFIYINDGTNQLIYVLDRQSLEIVSTFGGHGHMAGQFYGAHVMAGNSKGDLFIGETYEGKRLQKFVYTGLGAPSQAP